VTTSEKTAEEAKAEAEQRAEQIRDVWLQLLKEDRATAVETAKAKLAAIGLPEAEINKMFGSS